MARLRSLRLSSLTRSQWGMLALIVVLLFVWVLVSRQESSANADAVALQDNIASVLENERDIAEENDLEALELELRQLEEEPLPQNLPSREDAFDFGSTIFGKASTLGVRLTSIESADDTIKLRGLELQAVSYELTAVGSEHDLTEMLALLDDFPSSVVRGLSFTNAGETWEMSVSLVVVYGGVAPPEVEEGEGIEEGA